MSIIINAGPTASGKTTYSRIWKAEDPDFRIVLEEANNRLDEALGYSALGYDVMLNVLTDAEFFIADREIA